MKKFYKLIHNNDIEGIKKYRYIKDNDRIPPLIYAIIKNSSLEMIKTIIEFIDKDIEVVFPREDCKPGSDGFFLYHGELWRQGYYNKSALAWACSGEEFNTEVVKFMIEKGSDINFKDSRDISPLDYILNKVFLLEHYSPQNTKEKQEILEYLKIK